MSQPTRSKPSKLRAACNNCNLGKVSAGSYPSVPRQLSSNQVKCSGEKTGCKRCENVQIDCVYTESRVGRVPGARAKRRSNTIFQDEGLSSEARPATRAMERGYGTNDTIATGSNVFTPSETSSTTKNGPRSEREKSFDNALMDWSSQLDDYQSQVTTDSLDVLNDTDGFFANLAGEDHQPQLSAISSADLFRQPTPRTTFPSTGSDYHVPVLDFESHDTWRNQNVNDQFQTNPTKRVNNCGSSSHSQCVIACSKMTQSLEKYISDDLKVLELIFSIAKRVISQLNSLLDLELECQHMKCMPLICVVMHQVVELLEAGCSNFIEDDEHSKVMSDPLGNSLSGFGFDGFATNGEHQRRWQSQMLLRELQPSVSILRRIGTLISADFPSGSGRIVGQREIHREIQTRMNILIHRMKNSNSMC
jgi:hypothetical protein